MYTLFFQLRIPIFSKSPSTSSILVFVSLFHCPVFTPTLFLLLLANFHICYRIFIVICISRVSLLSVPKYFNASISCSPFIESKSCWKSMNNISSSILYSYAFSIICLTLWNASISIITNYIFVIIVFISMQDCDSTVILTHLLTFFFIVIPWSCSHSFIVANLSTWILLFAVFLLHILLDPYLYYFSWWAFVFVFILSLIPQLSVLRLLDLLIPHFRLDLLYFLHLFYFCEMFFVDLLPNDASQFWICRPSTVCSLRYLNTIKFDRDLDPVLLRYMLYMYIKAITLFELCEQVVTAQLMASC